MAVNRYFANTQLAGMVDISAGEVVDVHKIDKFGYNSAVGNTSYETIWDGNNLYTYIETAGTATVTSSNTAADNGSTVEIQGLDANYDQVSETLTVGGSAGTVEFYRVHRARVVTPNTGSANVGTVTVTVDSKSAAIISPTQGQTLMCVYTIPRRYTGYLLQLDIGSSKDVENTIRVVIRNGASEAFNTKAFITKRGGFSEKNFKIPLEISQKNDIEVQAISSAPSQISSGFELILCKK